jgi:type II secretory pathway component PulF
VIVYEYSAVSIENKAQVEQGTVLARDKVEAFDKLKRRHLTDIRLKRMEGFSALIGKFTASVR